MDDVKWFKYLLIPICACGMSAQTAVLTGLVSDESQAVVPAAKVRLYNASGFSREVVTGQDGQYAFTNVQPGDYLVSAFANQLLSPKPVSLTLQPGSRTLNFQLVIETTSQFLAVPDNDGASVSTETTGNASATVVKGDDLQSLGDDPEDLQSDLRALAGPSAGPSGSEILIDGFSDGELPPKESIREVRINQDPFSSEYDKMGLGRVEVFTKPGTEKYHGVVSWNLGTDHWNSRNPYASQKEPFLLRENEDSLSGPLSKRISFTFNLQWQAVDNSSVVNAVIPDPATSLPAPFNGIQETPQRRLRIDPRFDYQWGEHSFLSVRELITRSDIHDKGIGGFDLVSQGYELRDNIETLQLIETWLHGPTVNETRIQYYRWDDVAVPNVTGPEDYVPGAFTGRGLPDGSRKQAQRNYSFQNNTYLVHGAHTWKAGVRLRGQSIDSVVRDNFQGTFTFTSIDQYRAVQLGEPGVFPARFTITAGLPETVVRQFDAAFFIADDWRLRPNLTITPGFRFESQTGIHDHADYAPRIGLAWAPRARTVLRAGFGVFYDRFALYNSLSAARYNGIVQQQYVVSNPDFYPNAPAIAALPTGSTQTIYAMDPHLRAPYLMQAAFTRERQLAPGTTLAITGTVARSLHVFRSTDITAAQGVSRTATGPVFLMSSSGRYNQAQLLVNLNSKVSSRMSFFGSYTLNRARSDTDGINTFPGNPFDYSGEYGPAATDIRNRLQFGSSVMAPWGLSLSPLFIWQSGAPFNIISGRDPYGTTLFFARPGIGPDGTLDPDPITGEPIIGRNAGRGASTMTANLRISKIWTLRRSKLSVGFSGRNIVNHTNQGPIIGNILSPLFGRSNQMADSANGQGFSETANNRRIELIVRLMF